MLVKVLASKPPKQSHRTSKARRFCEVLQALIKWSQKGGLRKSWSQKYKNEKSTDVAEENDGVTAEKIKFPLYVFPETMKTVDILYKSDNCSSRTEFMEKAIRFYCGYLLQNKPELVDYLAPQIATITEGIVKGTEQRLSRALFKVAVELGAITHMLAAVHDIDDDTMIKLRAMCTDEVKRINGIINFEKAVRYQRPD